MPFLVGLFKKSRALCLPGSSMIYQAHLFFKEGHLLWMDEILHHFEFNANHCLLVFTGELIIPGFRSPQYGILTPSTVWAPFLAIFSFLKKNRRAASKPPLFWGVSTRRRCVPAGWTWGPEASPRHRLRRPTISLGGGSMAPCLYRFSCTSVASGGSLKRRRRVLGLDSPFFSTVVLFKNRIAVSPGLLRWFPEKTRITGKNGGKSP